MSLLRAVAALALLATPACGSGSGPELEYADWVFPVPEGTPIIEYAPVGIEERAENVVEMVEDLVIGGDPNDPNTSFYRPIAVVAADNGNIFVVDNGNTRVQMFGPDGTFLRTLGREGQGPGEFTMPMAATIAGDRLVVADIQNSRFSVWTVDGEHVADHATPLGVSARDLGGLADGRMIVESTEMDMSGLTNATSMPAAMPTMTTVLSSYSASGERLQRFLETAVRQMPSPQDLMADSSARLQYMIDIGDTPRPSFAIGGGRMLYITPASEYQVLAMTGSGEMSWALRVAWPRRPYPDSRKQTRMRLTARDNPELSADDFEWPEFDNALFRTLRSDGRGRLYAFPIADRPPASDDAEEQETEDDTEDRPRGRPVDVYSTDGELIVAGLTTATWQYARGDYVYRIQGDPDTDETLVVRYRLIVNDR